MVPFYGQGMNAGFEDVERLFEKLDLSGITSLTAKQLDLTISDFVTVGKNKVEENQFKSSLELVLRDYSETRYPDALAICKLAMDNYVEMRSSVV